MPSVQHQAVGWALRAAGVKRQFASADSVTGSGWLASRTSWLTSRVQHAPTPPAALRRSLQIRETRGDDAAGQRWRVFELAPPRLLPERTVVFFPGGAYLNEMTPMHWGLVGDLVRDVPARVLVARYPLTPGATAAATVARAAELIGEVIDGVGGSDVVVMGDSAGGGLALAAVQLRRDTGPDAERPALLALVSPWLDVTMSDPEQMAIEPLDPMLARPGLAAAGRLHAGDLSTEDPRVSPLFGSMSGLPPMLVLTSTSDVLLPDSRRLRAVASAAGVAVDYREEPDLFHDYALFPAPEGERARALLVAACRDLPTGSHATVPGIDSAPA